MIQHPRIGIRPTIDGRRQGVRESLEVQTMNMAKSVADLISSTLKYPDWNRRSRISRLSCMSVVGTTT